jgi:hypothetical protein
MLYAKFSRHVSDFLDYIVGLLQALSGFGNRNFLLVSILSKTQIKNSAIVFEKKADRQNNGASVKQRLYYLQANQRSARQARFSSYDMGAKINKGESFFNFNLFVLLIIFFFFR